MLNALRPAVKFVPALAATVAVIAGSAPPASAETVPTAWLNPQTGVLSFTGTPENDWVKVTKLASPSVPGGYVLRLEILRYTAPNYSANCTLGGGLNDWLVTCPAAGVAKLTFDGQSGGDSFSNATSVPSEAHGGPNVDIFYGGDGPDDLHGDGESDKLYGGGGADVIDGGAGLDTVGGGNGTDVASWADAPSAVTASLDDVGNDGVAGENENVPSDFEGLRGSQFADSLSGNGSAPDTLLGGDGADDLQGWSGDDVLKGEAGNDTLHPNSGSDVLDGGADSDGLSYAGVGNSVYVYQDGAANDGMLGENDNVISIENLTGSSFGDDLEGTPADDVLHGAAGGDKITPKFGDDQVYGGAGPDYISGGPGMPADCGNLGCTKFDTDTVSGGPDSDRIDYSSRGDNLTIAIDGSAKSGGFMENDALSSIENAIGGSGNDTIYGNAAPNSLVGGGGGDGIVGRAGNDDLSGEQGNDYLESGTGNNWVTGGDDNDTLVAIGGNDTLYGGNGGDRVSYLGAPTGIVAHIGAGTSGTVGEADKIGSDVEDLEGSIYADKLYGNAAANHLIGYGQADLLVGNGGADVEDGGTGADTLNSAGDGTQDQSSCGSGADVANADAIDVVSADCETIHKT